MGAPVFASIGKATGRIDVRLSYRIIELFSEGLYQSPNKAVEELVANSFDAGAHHVQVLLSTNLQSQDATITVVDDGEGMDAQGLRQHWLIGISNKRELTTLPLGRQQIGKFGIGKLATYVLANRLTHVSKQDGRFFSTSMDFTAIDTTVNREVEPRTPIRIQLRELTEDQAKEALSSWTETAGFKRSGMILFGRGATRSWTVSIMSALKPKVNEIKPGLTSMDPADGASFKARLRNLVRWRKARPKQGRQRPIKELGSREGLGQVAKAEPEGDIRV